MVSGPEVLPSASTRVVEERIKVAIYLEYPEQTITLGSTLTEDGRIELCGLLKRNLDIFTWKPADMTGVPRHVAEHRLNVREGCPPVKQKKRSQAPERNKAIQEKVERLVKVYIMKEVHYHSWLSNPVMVKKHDDSWRMCVDFKYLNKACPKDGHPLPEIDLKVESLCGYPFKCFLDTYKGYHQIKMAMEDEEKTSFITIHGIFCYSKMPFGLKNAEATCQRLVDKAFQKQIGRNFENCTKKSDFQWTTEAEAAFKQMKRLIAELPTITTPMENEELIVYLAATREAVSAVLMTEREAKQIAIYFVSRALQGPEINYTPLEKLVLALVHASKRLKRYFQAHPIIVITYQPIKQVLSKPEIVGRLQKWSIELGEYNIHYMPRVSIKGQILSDFIVERPKDDSLAAPMEVEEELPDSWTLFTDGSSCVDGSGVGLILTNPEGTKFTYALRFEFNATNNEAEYEAQIAGLRIAEQMAIKKPSNTFLNQASVGENKKAGPLSKIASTSFAHLTKQVLVEVLKEKSINEAEVLTIVEEEGNTWMTPIYEYLTEETLPAEKKKARSKLTPITSPWPFYKWEINIDGPFPEDLGKKKKREQAAIREARSKAKMEKYYNFKVRNTSFKPGDIVYRSNDASHAEDGGKLGPKNKGFKVRCSQKEPLKVMISGAPASGKGTQCELIVQKYGLVHISTGDLLRTEVAAGSEIGNQAKEYMNSGRLVPDEVVTAMVIGRLSRADAKEKGWLLDGFPRSFAQAQSLEKMKIRPDVFIALDVPDEILIDRCVGRRLDPETGKIYHIKNFPPETEEVKARLITRPDDTEEKVKSRLQIYKQNVEAIVSTYSDLLKKIDGNRSKDVIFGEISSLLLEVQKEKETRKSGKFAVILEYMDWGSDGAMGNFINIGAIGGKEVDEVDDIFILVAPQNAMGNCIIDEC
nr:adenylate kinase 5, chloroplastic [Tanacetum cinerariifolium]